MQLRTLNNNDFLVMRQFELIFGPIANALDILQGEMNTTQGHILPVLTSMKTRIQLIPETNNITCDFKTVILKLIETKFEKYFEYSISNSDLILSSITIPRFKTSFISSEMNQVYARNLLVSECKKMFNEEENVSNDVPSVDMENAPEDDFIISFTPNRSDRRNSIDSLIETEISKYLLDSRKETNILDEYRFIRAVFYKYNTTFSSSAPVERIFSQSGMIFTPRRNRISAKNFEMTLFLKINKILFNRKCNE